MCAPFLFLFLDATVYVGGLDEKVTEALIWELFLQSGPVGKSTHERVHKNQSYKNEPAVPKLL